MEDLKPVIETARESFLEVRRFSRGHSLPSLDLAELSTEVNNVIKNENGNGNGVDYSVQNGHGNGYGEATINSFKQVGIAGERNYRKNLTRRRAVSEGDAGSDARIKSPVVELPPSPQQSNEVGGFRTIDSFSIGQSDSREVIDAPSPVNNAPVKSTNDSVLPKNSPRQKEDSLSSAKASTSILPTSRSSSASTQNASATPGTNGRPRRSTASSTVKSNGKSKFIDHESDPDSDSDAEMESGSENSESEEEAQPKSKGKPVKVKRAAVSNLSELSDFEEQSSPAKVKKTYSKGTVVANDDKLTCPHSGCDKKFSQRNGLKYHLKHGRCNVPGTKSFVEEMKGKPHVCYSKGCGKRYKNRNGLRYHYEHSPDHGAYGMQLFAEDRHPRPEGPAGEGGSDGNLDSPPKVKPMRKTSTYVRTSRVDRASKKAEADDLKKTKAEAKASNSDSLLPFQTFSSEYLAAKTSTAKIPLNAKLEAFMKSLGMRGIKDRVSCDYCFGTGVSYDWIELEGHLLGNHATSLEAYCAAAPSQSDLPVSNNSSMAPREVSASMELDSTTSVCSTCQIAFTGNNAAADLKRHEEIKHMDELDEEEDAAGSDDDDFDFSTSSAIPVNGNGSIIATTVPVSIEVNSSLGVKREASNTVSPQSKKQKV